MGEHLDKKDVKTKTVNRNSVYREITVDHKDQSTNEKKRKFDFREFSQYTSLHGLKFIGDDNSSKTEKLLWLFAFIASVILCGYLILEVWIKWYESPVVVSFGDTETSILNIPFPAITVCSAEKFLNSTFNYERKCRSNGISDEELFRLESLALLCNSHCHLETYDKPAYPGGKPIKKPTKPGIMYTNESAIDALKEIMLQIGDVLAPCVDKDPKHCFRPILTSQGNCFTYNMLNINEIFREDVVNINYTSANVPDDGWSLQHGYPENSNENTYPIRGKSSGLQTALKLHLKRNRSEEENICSGDIKGYKIAVHLPSLLPPIDEDFIWVPLNVQSMISVVPQMMTISKGLRKYNYKRRNCFFPHEKSLRFYKVYSQENCNIECVTNYTMAECGCVKFSMPHDKNTTLCSTEKMKCISNTKRKLFSKVTTWDPSSKKSPIANCECLPSCTSLSYAFSVSHIPNKNEKRGDVWDRNSARIYFKSPYFMISQKSELYGITDFLANIGGLLGLCLGISIMSLAEIIHIMILRYRDQKK